MMVYVPAESVAEQYILAIGLSILTTVFVGLRYHVRRITRLGLLWDDWFIVVSLVFTYLTAIFIIISTAAGNQGRHMQIENGHPIINGRYIIFLKMLYAGQLSQVLAVGPTKIAIVLFYRRIFSGRAFNIITWTLIVLACCWTVTFFFAMMFQCTPIDTNWKHAVGKPQCVRMGIIYSQAFSDVSLDLLILLVPIPFVLQLCLPLKKKIAIIGMFLLGVLTIAASCAKAIVYTQISVGVLTPSAINLRVFDIEGEADFSETLAQKEDLTFYVTPIVYWPLIEASLGIIAACLPLMGPLFRSRTRNNTTTYTFSANAFRSRPSRVRVDSEEGVVQVPSPVLMKSTFQEDEDGLWSRTKAHTSKSRQRTCQPESVLFDTYLDGKVKSTAKTGR